MTKRNRKFARRTLSATSLLAATSLILGACSDGNTSGGGDSENIAKIGVFLPLTQENAENGLQMRKAIEMFADEYNEADNDFKIELVVRDDRGEPKTATNIAREFAQDDDIIAAIGSFTSTGAMAGAPIFDEAGIPQIGPTSSHPDFTGLGKYVFRGGPTQKTEGLDIANFATETLGMKTGVIVHRQDDWGISAAENYQIGFEQVGGEILAVEAVAPDARDLRSVVTSLKSSGAESIMIALQYSDAARLAEQMRAAGWSPTVITSSALYSEELIELSDPEAIEGWNVPSFYFSGSSDPAIRAFVDGFEERYGELPIGHAASAYDSTHVVVKALEQIETFGSEGRQALGEAMFKTEVSGITGEMKFDENGDIEKPLTWLSIKDGVFFEQ